MNREHNEVKTATTNFSTARIVFDKRKQLFTTVAFLLLYGIAV
jgi:hypothetical protein